MKIIQFVLADPVFMKNTSRTRQKILKGGSRVRRKQSCIWAWCSSANTRVLIVITDAGRCTYIYIYIFDMCNKGRHVEITAAGKSAAVEIGNVLCNTAGLTCVSLA